MGMVADVCTSLRLEYYVTGSIASMAYSEGRTTQDVDIVVELPPWKMADFCAPFQPPEFYASPDAAVEAARTGTQFNIVWTTAGIKADIIAFRDGPFDESVMFRARPFTLPAGTVVRMSSPEDVILNKLIYYREGGSEKHTRDIASIFRVSGKRLDLAYIERWVPRLGLEREWGVVMEAVRDAPWGGGPASPPASP